MKLIIVTVIVFVVVDAASVKRTSKDEITPQQQATLVQEKKIKVKPAILAIEIIDEDDNSTNVKNTTKRTIESSLGYGRPDFFSVQQPRKRLEYYKYSQHDIPPVEQAHSSFSGQWGDKTQYDIQKSIAYHIGDATNDQHQQVPTYSKLHTSAVNHYQPGTVLYSTVNQQGQVGALSNNLPYQNHGNNGVVPVIVLRVYSNQLSNPVYSNFPQAHPYSNLNNVNLQSLLAGYLQQAQAPDQHQNYQVYEQPNQNQYYYQVPQFYQTQQYVGASSLPTSENYPDEHHTRVVFHSNNNGHIPVKAPLAGLGNYQTVDHNLQSQNLVYVQTPDTQYSYGTPGQDQGYVYDPPNVNEQELYYTQGGQHENQQYVGSGSGGDFGHVPGVATQHSPDEPFNYHAHSSGHGAKGRSKKSSSVRTATSSSSSKRDVTKETSSS